MIKMAIAYDFDGTLAKGNIQENSFLPKLGISKEEFWKEVKEEAQSRDANEILMYMYLIRQKAEKAQINISLDELKKHGANVDFFDGVEEYFTRINKYAEERGVKIEHYIISSGTKEMIEGTSIAKHFKVIFASSFGFDEYGKPCWPYSAIDYTSKTQYLYRISKGILNTWDSSKINKTIPDNQREIRFENMVYIGDGETDIPAMTLLKSKKGVSIVVYDKNKEDKINQAKKILEDDKANYAVDLNYSEDGELDKVIKSIIDKVVINEQYGKYQWSNNNQTTKKADNLLQQLDIEYFVVGEKRNDLERYILLEQDSWNDSNYETLFRIHRIRKQQEEYLGKVKIGYVEQPRNYHTSQAMPKEFQELDKKFFSVIKILNQELSQDEKEALQTLLNPLREDSEYENEEIVKNSLRRKEPFNF